MNNSWRRARRCVAGDCLEAACRGWRVFVRDSKDPAVVVAFERGAWITFVNAVKAGDAVLMPVAALT